MKLPGAELLIGKAQAGGEGLTGRGSVLGVSQHGAAQEGAVDPQLMGPAGEGLQLQQAPGRALLQQTVSGSGRRRLGLGQRPMGISMVPSGSGGAPYTRP